METQTNTESQDFIKEILSLADAKRGSALIGNDDEILAELVKLGDAVNDIVIKLSMDYTKLKALIDEEYKSYASNTTPVESGIYKIRSAFSDLRKKRSDIIEKLEIILGLIYDGTLVNEKDRHNGITFRDGKMYRFRCRYTLSLKQVLDEMLEAKGEVIEKLANNKDAQKILVYVFSAFAKLEQFSSIDDLERTTMTKELPLMHFIQPDFETNGTGTGRFYIVDNFKIDGYNLNFCYGEKNQPLNTYYKFLLEKVFYKDIQVIMESFVKRIETEQIDSDIMLNEISNKFAKQLVFAELKKQK